MSERTKADEGILTAGRHPGDVGVDAGYGPVTSEYVEELRAFVAAQDRIAMERRAEALSQKPFCARLVSRVRSMKWQDVVFSIGEVVFMVGLVPSVLGPDKPAAITSLSTAAMLLAYLAVHRSFKLWGAFVLTLITVTMWSILAGQVIFS